MEANDAANPRRIKDRSPECIKNFDMSLINFFFVRWATEDAES